MRFCTVINCMDGRVQVPVLKYLQERFDAEYVDSITEPGPNLILAENTDQATVQSILGRLKISIEQHGSKGIAIVAHYDCAGNPASKDEQIKHIARAIQFIEKYYDGVKIIGLWVNESWQVEELTNFESDR